MSRMFSQDFLSLGRGWAVIVMFMNFSLLLLFTLTHVSVPCLVGIHLLVGICSSGKALETITLSRLLSPCRRAVLSYLVFGCTFTFLAVVFTYFTLVFLLHGNSSVQYQQSHLLVFLSIMFGTTASSSACL
jgi:hypothetical protein